MITHERLLYLLNYDPTTGNLTWKNPTSNRVKTGDIAGHKSKDYAKEKGFI